MGNNFFKKKLNLAMIITSSAIAAIAIGAGIPVGIYLGRQFRGGEEVNYDDVQTDGLSVDYDQYFKLYQKKRSEGGDYLTDTTPAQMVNMAYALLSKTEEFETRGFGLGNASIVNQEIRSCVVKKDGKFFEESLSLSSLVNVAWRMYEEGDTTTQYKGKCRSGNPEVALFKQEDSVDYTSDEYFAWWGKNVSSPTAYVLTDDTVLTNPEVEDKMYGVTSVTKSDTGYVIDLELHPILSVLNYVVQMQAISDLPKKPAFVYVHLTMTTDLDLKVLQVVNTERYYANTGAVGSYVSSTMTTYYKYDDVMDIPSLHTPVEYQEEK